MANERELLSQKNRELSTTATNLQSKLDSMANEGDLLSQKNRELSTEAESLKGQLKESNARNDRVLEQCRTENNDLQSDLKKLSIEVEFFKYLGNASESEMKRTLQTSEEDQKHLKSKFGRRYCSYANSN